MIEIKNKSCFSEIFKHILQQSCASISILDTVVNVLAFFFKANKITLKMSIDKPTNVNFNLPIFAFRRLDIISSTEFSHEWIFFRLRSDLAIS